MSGTKRDEQRDAERPEQGAMRKRRHQLQRSSSDTMRKTAVTTNGQSSASQNALGEKRKPAQPHAPLEALRELPVLGGFRRGRLRPNTDCIIG